MLSLPVNPEEERDGETVGNNVTSDKQYARRP